MKHTDWLALGYDSIVPIAPPMSGGPDAGKVPGRYDAAAGRWYGFSGWSRVRPTQDEAKEWEAWGAGVGLVNADGRFFILDIDSYDEATGDAIERKARAMLGDAPRRVGEWPKRALLYRAAEPLPKVNLPYGEPAEGQKQDRIETTPMNGQIVVEGTHPKTGKPYQWDRPVPRVEDLPEVTGEQVRRFFDLMAAKLPKAKLNITSAHQGPAKSPAELMGDPDLIRQAVEATPNPRDLGYEAYIAMGQAIRGAFGPGHEEDAFDCWHEWVQRWEGGPSDEDLVRKHWNTMTPSRTLGADYVLSRSAPEFNALRFFAPIVANPVDDMFDAVAPVRSSGLFEVLDIDGILRLPDPQFAIARHIPETSMGFLYGRPGCGKSFIALDWALHMAYGMADWHGDAITIRPNANVLYLAREGSTGFKARIQAWQQARFIPEDRKPTFQLIRQTINFMQAEDIDKLLRTAEQAIRGPVDLVVVDTVSRVMPGADENLQKEMTLFVKACDALQDRLKAIVLGVHHSGKSGDMRGSSVLKGAGDFVFKLERKEGAKFATLYCEKQKDAPDGWQERYALDSVEFEGGKSLVPRRLDADGQEAEAASCSESQRDLIFDAISVAWNAGRPWSAEPRAKDRYAPQRMALDFDVRAEIAAQWLDIWMQEGLIEVATRDHKSKMRGYRVASAVEDAAIFE